MYEILQNVLNTDRRQGDAILVRIDEYPSLNVSRTDKTLVLGEGHHAHQFLEQVDFHKGTMKMDTGEKCEAEFFTLSKDTELQHLNLDGSKGEHNTIPMEAGNYAYVKEREYDPFADECKVTAD